MEKRHKELLGIFRRNNKYKLLDGKSITLESIILDYRKLYTIPNDEFSYRDVLEYCHPYLYYNYIVDWSVIPSTRIPREFNTGLEFGKRIIKDWQDYCFKNKIWNFDSFKCFKTQDELTNAIAALLPSDKLYLPESDFQDLEAKLHEDKISKDADDAAKTKAEMERLEKQRLELLAEDKKKEAERKAEEQRRQEAYDEAQRVAQFNKDMHAVWVSGKSNTDADETKTSKSKTTKTTKKINIIDTTKNNETMKQDSPFVEGDQSIANAINPFINSSMDMIMSPLPAVASNQLMMYRSDKNSMCCTYGDGISKGFITARIFNGEQYLCTENKNIEFNAQLMIQLENYYNAKRYMLFTLSDNLSRNPVLNAYRIINVECE